MKQEIEIETGKGCSEDNICLSVLFFLITIVFETGIEGFNALYLLRIQNRKDKKKYLRKDSYLVSYFYVHF